jgi:hypothetical protein
MNADTAVVSEPGLQKRATPVRYRSERTNVSPPLFLRKVDEDGEPNYLTVTLSKTPSGWRQTDALAGDDTFEVMATAVRTGGIR